LVLWIFSRESDSTITNVCSFVRPSVRNQNPSTAWNHHPSSFIIHPSSFFIHSFFINSSFIFVHPSFISRLLSFSACFSWIEPVFLYGMCIGHTRSHAKFQTSGLNILKWRPLFVNGSWPSRKSFKMTWKLIFWPCHP